MVWISDASDFEARPLTIARNGSTIAGLNEDLTVDVALASFQLVAFAGDWRIV